VSLKQLKGIRWAVRATLALGVIASTVANILHADPNVISQTIAAWPPLALLLTIELISRAPVHRPILSAVRVVATVLIAGIAAWVSYWHMVGVIARYGETGAGPYLIPLTVDGLVVVASVCLVELGGRIQAATKPQWAMSEPHPATPDAPAQSLATPTRLSDARKRPTPESSDPRIANSENLHEGQPGGSRSVRSSKQISRDSEMPRPSRSRRPASTGKASESAAEQPGNNTREVKVPQTAEACARWIACWIAMCRDDLDTGPISLSLEAEAKRRYGWGVKQIRDVRNAATSGQLRLQASLLGVALPTEYVDGPSGAVRNMAPASKHSAGTRGVPAREHRVMAGGSGGGGYLGHPGIAKDRVA
jgi:hypothetical protein